MAKLFVIFGATGQQGGSLIDYLLAHPEFSKTFRLRGVTRDVSKPAAQKLTARGVEVVQADMSDPTSLPPVLDGAYAVFLVTNFWDTGSADTETAQGKAVADAALAANVSLLIWSSLPNVTELTNGEVTELVHFDSKAKVEDHIRSLGFPSSVFFHAGWYMQNVKNPGMPKLIVNPDGSVIYPFALPADFELPYIDITDIGKLLAPAIRDPAKYNGKRIIGAQDFHTTQDALDIWSRVTGRKIRPLTQEEIPEESRNDPLQVILRASVTAGKVGFYGPTGHDDLKWTLAQLDPADKLTTWEEYVKREGPWLTD